MHYKHVARVKYPELVKAFTVGPRFSKRIYVDLETHTNLLRSRGIRFTFGLVSTYSNEIIHAGFRQMSKQEVFDMQNLIVQDFLGVPITDQWRDFRDSDYYDKTNSRFISVLNHAWGSARASNK